MAKCKSDYWRAAHWTEGWIVVDAHGMAEPDAPFTDRATAEATATKINADYDAWNRAGLADAPHLDNF